jgi:DNA recombination protein RmuC
MVYITILIAFIAGFILGVGLALVLLFVQSKTARELADELFRETEAQRKAQVDSVVENIKAIFGSLSLDALSKSTEEFLKLAKARLDSEREVNVKELDEKKNLIDQQLQRMTSELENVSHIIKELEKDRIEKFGELTNHLKVVGDQTRLLTQTTNTLREALSSSRVRGQWGERMAEDVLQLAGFIENINYLKQKAIEGGSRPDFTFLLPQELKLNMDVKFPLDNYLRYLEAQTEVDKAKFRNDFLRDVRNKIKEVTTRDYINPEQNTVDYVLLFIPNEQVYAFIHEQDHTILDEGIKNHVVFCSPLTLFAVLAVIRQAVENFALEKTSNEILSIFGAFRKQWDEFIKKMDVLGKRIDDVQKEYDALRITRRKQLEKPLIKIESLRTQRQLPVAIESTELEPDDSAERNESK